MCMEMFLFYFKDEVVIFCFGEDLVLVLGLGFCVVLEGDFGVGKFMFVCVILWVLVNDLLLEVLSFIFMLVQVYDLCFQVGYFDFYWIGDFSELDEFGFDEILEMGVCFVEWFDCVGNWLF